MAHFYGEIQGNKGEASRLGSKQSGFRTVAASWSGAIETYIYWDKDAKRNMFSVYLIPWGGSSDGKRKLIAEGILDSAIDDPYIPALIA